MRDDATTPKEAPTTGLPDPTITLIDLARLTGYTPGAARNAVIARSPWVHRRWSIVDDIPLGGAVHRLVLYSVELDRAEAVTVDLTDDAAMDATAERCCYGTRWVLCRSIERGVHKRARPRVIWSDLVRDDPGEEHWDVRWYDPQDREIHGAVVRVRTHDWTRHKKEA